MRLAGAVAKYCTHVKGRQLQSENRKDKNNSVQQKYVLIHRPKPKLTTDAVQIMWPISV